MGKVVTLGEIMLRLSTENGIRMQQAENFQAHYGGGEANVAISLANYGHEVSFASRVPDNALGIAVKKHLNRYAVSTESLLFGGSRLGTYFLETGTGERASNVTYDRKGSSFTEVIEVEWDTKTLFKEVDIFHITGITPALSTAWSQLTLILIQQAKKAGAKISFDVNYRSKLWSQKEAGKAIKEILPLVDYCSIGKMDALYLLNIPAYQKKSSCDELTYYYREIQKLFPTIQLFYSTNRTIFSASTNDLSGVIWQNGQYVESQCHRIHPIIDRVGGGDAFAGGIIHGILENWSLEKTICFATAASALKHTVQGDCNQFSEAEVLDFLSAGSGKISR